MQSVEQHIITHAMVQLLIVFSVGHGWIKMEYGLANTVCLVLDMEVVSAHEILMLDRRVWCSDYVCSAENAWK